MVEIRRNGTDELYEQLTVGALVRVEHEHPTEGAISDQGIIVSLTDDSVEMAGRPKPIRRNAITRLTILASGDVPAVLDPPEGVFIGDRVRVIYRGNRAGDPMEVIGDLANVSTFGYTVRRDDGSSFGVRHEDVIRVEVLSRMEPVFRPWPDTAVVIGHTPLSIVFYGAYGTAYSWVGNPGSPRPSITDMPLVDRAVLRALAADIIAEIDRET